MTDKRRLHKRIEKPISIQFCVAGVSPKKWDISVLENISVGGIKFIAQGDLTLKDKVIQLQIRVPALAPHVLELEAVVLEVELNTKAGLHTQGSEIRAKFINLSEANRARLSVVEKIMG